ncbi:MAG TPA: LysR family transcriptional regulator [Gemmataceae bacterium]|nr:LysR family transcriptional regulator [Gemmataceae bacterium]
MGSVHLTWKEERCPLQKLRSFCLVAQTGSVTKAAELCSLSQPTVSLQIQALERRLNVALFRRHGPKISLTPEGRTLYNLVRPLVTAFDALADSFEASRQGLETGELSIAAGESTILYILPEFIRAYTRTYPGVELRLHNVTGRDGLHLLRSDSIDFAVGPLIERPEDIAFEPLFTYDPVLIVPPDHPLASRKRITLKDIAQYPLILPPRHLTTSQAVDHVFRTHKVNYRVALEAGGWEVVKKYVECGVGVSIVTSVCLTGTEGLTAIKLTHYFPQRTYGIVLRKFRPLSTQATCFLELLRRGAPQTK